MRVVHLSTVDIGGGAARGSFALHQELVKRGVDSLLVVEQRKSTSSSVFGDTSLELRLRNKIRHRLDQLPLQAYRGRDSEIFSLASVPGNVVGRVRTLEPDVVHLHWVGASFVRPEDLPRFGTPIVWTMRDMWPFTGGCHLSGGCDRYEEACGQCPQLGSSRAKDLSRWVWGRKERSWKRIDLTPVALSNWSARMARRSSLLSDRGVRVISNGIDVGFWTEQERATARAALGLPFDVRILLFIAFNLRDEHKGFAEFAEASRLLLETESVDSVQIVVVGGADPSDQVDLGWPTRYLGRLSDDEQIRNAYSAADVTVVPSREEAFGKTAAESLACGTPVVCFDDTGLVDVVDHEETGFRAAPFDPADLARGISWTIEDESRLARLSTAARKAAVQRFSVGEQATQYIELYREILL